MIQYQYIGIDRIVQAFVLQLFPTKIEKQHQQQPSCCAPLAGNKPLLLSGAEGVPPTHILCAVPFAGRRKVGIMETFISLTKSEKQLLNELCFLTSNYNPTKTIEYLSTADIPSDDREKGFTLLSSGECWVHPSLIYLGRKARLKRDYKKRDCRSARRSLSRLEELGLIKREKVRFSCWYRVNLSDEGICRVLGGQLPVQEEIAADCVRSNVRSNVRLELHNKSSSSSDSRHKEESEAGASSSTNREEYWSDLGTLTNPWRTAQKLQDSILSHSNSSPAREPVFVSSAGTFTQEQVDQLGGVPF
jgi:hypothetical protein